MSFLEEQHKWACKVIEDDFVWFYYKGDMCSGKVIELKYGKCKEILYLVEFRDLRNRVKCAYCGSTLEDGDNIEWDGVYDVDPAFKEITLAHHELVNPRL
jgi:hypothetical protein